jgi:hypothetical protein
MTGSKPSELPFFIPKFVYETRYLLKEKPFGSTWASFFFWQVLILALSSTVNIRPQLRGTKAKWGDA